MERVFVRVWQANARVFVCVDRLPRCKRLRIVWGVKVEMM